MLIPQHKRVKTYHIGRGFVWTNQIDPAIRYASSKSVGRHVDNSLSRIENTLKQEVDKGLNKVEVPLPMGQGSDVVKAVKSNIRNIVQKGQYIPNHDAIMTEVIKSANIQDVQPKSQRGKSVGNKSLSELLASTRKKATGKGMVLHGGGPVLHGQVGAGFAYA